MKILLWLVSVFAVVAGGWWLFASLQDDAGQSEIVEELAFADVVITDLVETETFEGSVERVSGEPVLARRAGTVTRLPEVGAVIGFGDVLFWIDEEPVVLLQGSVPAFRTMRRNTEGADVLQLEEALSSLGFVGDFDMTVDGEFTATTGDVVAEWQEATGFTVDETIALGDVVYWAEPIRVSEVLTALGKPVRDGDALLATSSDDLLVTFGLPAADQGLLDVGDSVVIDLPDGSVTAGTVVEVASAATRAQDGSTSFEVTVEPDDPSLIAGFEDAPVDVEVVSESVEDVLAVPVTALLALSEGGYAVEVDLGDGKVRLVGVVPGFYADGLVEITSDQVVAGDRVVVP